MAQTSLRLYHHQSGRYLHATGKESLVLRLRVRPPAPAACFVHYRSKGGWRHHALYPYSSTARSIYFQARLEDVPQLIDYYFQAYVPGGSSVYLGRSGQAGTATVIPFAYRWSPENVFATPSWVQDAIFYQIFPDRFANGDTSNDPPEVYPWGAKPTRNSFFGGDLEGIRQGIPYLKELGVTAIWLNPIFAAPSTHRYDTSDYLEIDPILGDKQVFHHLLKELHDAGIRLILDGVFNHTGNRFWAFADIMERGSSSPYLDWYYVHDLPLRTEPVPNYEAWWGFAELPKLRETNPLVRRYLLGVARYWTDLGIDGWRLDVPNEIKGDFWVEFRQVLKAMNPEVYLVGEIWRDGRPWLRGDQFDAVMNYLFRELVLNFFARETIDLLTFDRLLGFLRLRYPEQVNYCLLNLLGSHDTARPVTEMARALSHRGLPAADPHEIARRLRPLVIFQMTYVGTPLIYYGDEVGLAGEEDPDCRRCLPWDPAQRNQELFRLYQHLAHLRHRYPALRRGSFETILLQAPERLYGYKRRWQNQSLAVFINAGPRTQEVLLPVAQASTRYDLLRGRPLPAHHGSLALQLEPYSGSIVQL